MKLRAVSSMICEAEVCVMAGKGTRFGKMPVRLDVCHACGALNGDDLASLLTLRRIVGRDRTFH